MRHVSKLLMPLCRSRGITLQANVIPMETGIVFPRHKAHVIGIGIRGWTYVCPIWMFDSAWLRLVKELYHSEHREHIPLCGACTTHCSLHQLNVCFLYHVSDMHDVTGQPHIALEKSTCLGKFWRRQRIRCSGTVILRFPPLSN